MRRMIGALIALLALWAMTGTAAAESWTGSIHGGASLPSGDYASVDKGDASTGWAIGGALDYGWKENLAIGFDGSWGQNTRGTDGQVTILGAGATSTVDQDEFKTWEIGGHAQYFFPVASSMPVKWYGLMGAGLYGFDQNQTVTVASGGTSTTTSFKGTDKRAGMRLGLGGLWWANPKVGVHAGVDYNIAFMDKDSSPYSSLSYMGAHVGLTFSIPSNAHQ